MNLSDNLNFKKNISSRDFILQSVTKFINTLYSHLNSGQKESEIEINRAKMYTLSNILTVGSRTFTYRNDF